MKRTPRQLIQALIPLWHANMAWAKVLLMQSFGLADAQDILNPAMRGTRQIPGTVWFVRPHGIGVDIFKTPDVGGIDCDFNKPNPDEWRLKIFFFKQVNDGQLAYEQYRELIEDEDLLEKTIREALHEL